MAAHGYRYEHRYRFSIDYEILSRYNYQITHGYKTFLLSRYNYQITHGYKTFLFEVRTKFMTKDINGHGQIIDYEIFDAELLINGERDDPYSRDIRSVLSCRLEEYYRMNKDEVDWFDKEVLDFVDQIFSDPNHALRLAIPILIEIEVRTVQQKDELLWSVMERAIRASNLPPFICP